MAELKIYDDIGTDEMNFFFGGEVQRFSAEKMRNLVDQMGKDDSIINCHLHSRGGSVIEGYTISDILRMSGKTINMTVDGLCASIATVILLAAPKENRKIYPNARLVIHNPFIPPFTLTDAYESTDLQKLVDELKAEENRLLDFYVDRTGASRDELKTLMDAETELSPEESLRLGFVNEILKPVTNNYYKFKNSKFKSIMDEKTKQEFEAKLKSQETVLNKVLRVFGFNSAGDRMAMDLTTADGQTLKITRESGDPQVGDEATPDGSHVMPDGVTIVVTDGKITEIKPAEDMEAIKKENADLKAEIESLKQSNSAMQNSIAEAKQAGEDAKALYNELKAIQSKYVPAKRTENFQEPKTTAMNKLTERLENAKKRK